MQNRYTGDIGDFAKYGLLRALGQGLKCGIAWYLFPDESHNDDGKHTAYLKSPEKWRGLDPVLFDRLTELVRSNQRNTRQIETSDLLGDAEFSNDRLSFVGDAAERAQQRAGWFRNVLSDVSNSSLVLADPDNGLCEDTKYQPSSPLFWKRMPLSEAHVLASGRTGIFYHHNSRYPGGHVNEIQYWLSLFGKDAIALYWRPVSNRTFFIVHPTDEMKKRILRFVDQWSPHFEMYSNAGDKPVQQQIPAKK